MLCCCSLLAVADSCHQTSLIADADGLEAHGVEVHGVETHEEEAHKVEIHEIKAKHRGYRAIIRHSPDLAISISQIRCFVFAILPFLDGISRKSEIPSIVLRPY